MDRFVLISADCHAVGRPEDFRPFIEPQYLDVFDEENRKRIELAREARKASEDGGLLFSKEALEEYHSHDETEDDVLGGTAGQWDSDTPRPGARGRRRRRRGGVPRTAARSSPAAAARPFRVSCAPPVCARTTVGSPTSARRHRVARAGIAQLPIHDVDLAIAEIELAARIGLKGVSVPLLFDDPARAAALPRAATSRCGRRARRTACRCTCTVARAPTTAAASTRSRASCSTSPRCRCGRGGCSTSCCGTACSNVTPTCSSCSPRARATGCPPSCSYLDYLYESKDFAHIRAGAPDAAE